MSSLKTSWVFVFSFSNELSEQDYLQELKGEMVALMDCRDVFREKVPETLRINYVYNDISPEDALKYVHRLSTRPDGVPHLAVKIYNVTGDHYVPS